MSPSTHCWGCYSGTLSYSQVCKSFAVWTPVDDLYGIKVAIPEMGDMPCCISAKIFIVFLSFCRHQPPSRHQHLDACWDSPRHELWNIDELHSPHECGSCMRRTLSLLPGLILILPPTLWSGEPPPTYYYLKKHFKDCTAILLDHSLLSHRLV